MAPRSTTKSTTRMAAEPDDPVPESSGQRKRPDQGQFRLQVDRQTKSSYATLEAAEGAGLIIKQRHPIVHVAIYNAIDGDRKVIELPE
jgi:hypothetical protein